MTMELSGWGIMQDNFIVLKKLRSQSVVEFPFTMRIEITENSDRLLPVIFDSEVGAKDIKNWRETRVSIDDAIMKDHA